MEAHSTNLKSADCVSLQIVSYHDEPRYHFALIVDGYRRRYFPACQADTSGDALGG